MQELLGNLVFKFPGPIMQEVIVHARKGLECRLGGSGSWSPMSCSQDHPGQQSSEGWTCLGHPLKGWLTYKAKLILAIWQEARWAALSGYLCVFMTWQLASPRASDPKEQGGSCNIFQDLASEVRHLTSIAFCFSFRPTLIEWERGLHKGVNSTRWRLKLATMFLPIPTLPFFNSRNWSEMDQICL